MVVEVWACPRRAVLCGLLLRRCFVLVKYFKVKETDDVINTSDSVDGECVYHTTRMSERERERDVVEEPEEEYNEEEDEDFDPTRVDKDVQVSSGSEEEEEEYQDADAVAVDTKGGVDYSKIESDTGGLVKTRRARLVEEAESRRFKYENIQEAPISDTAKNVWDEMQNISKQRLTRTRGTNGSILSDTVSTPDDLLQEEQIMIERTYKFAGETVHEKKMVPKFSAEGQEYLKNLKFKSQIKEDARATSTEDPQKRKHVSNEQYLNLRRPLKREPILEKIIAGTVKPKLTTLEKSKLDWVNYVDKEGITDDLALHNRDGFLAKQDFLDRVESHKDLKYKELRKQQLAMQFQDQQRQ